MTDSQETTELLLIRHGETEWNLQRRMQGHRDSPLTALGLAQASAIADRLSRKKPHALYSSDLGRAAKTADVISNATGLPVRHDCRLRERSIGILEGLTWEEVESQCVVAAGKFREDPDSRPPDGESSLDVFERLREWMAEISRNHVGQRVAAVTHGGILMRVLLEVMGLPIDYARRFSLFNASLSGFVFDGKDWKMTTWGDIAHLENMNTEDDY